MSNSEDDFLPPKDPGFLKKQLERSRFERALEVAESMVGKGAYLNTAELARLNNIILGTKGEPWRVDAAVCRLPGGREEKFQILSDPITKAKEILTAAKNKAAAGEVIEAAADVYAQFVLTHVFKDGNRRTAVVALAYLLQNYGIKISAVGLHELGLGDLRALGQQKALKTMLDSTIKATNRKETI